MTQASRRLPALLAAAGLLSSLLLEAVHRRTYVDPRAIRFCHLGAHFDCASVALSPYSVVLGVPLPIWGAAGFLGIGFAAHRGSKLFLPLAAAGALASLASLALELTQIHSLCLLCEVVHALCLALFLIAWRTRESLRPVARDDALEALGLPAVLVVGSMLALPTYWKAFSWKGGMHLPHGVDTEGNAWLGAENPTVVLHEYADYACPHCALARGRLLQILATHSKRLRLVHHEFPRMRCPNVPRIGACQPARAAMCAGEQSKYWEMGSWLFEHAPGHVALDYAAAAHDLGLDGGKLTACMEAQETFDKADAAERAATHAHVLEAPTFVLDGKRYSGGAVFEELKKRL